MGKRTWHAEYAQSTFFQERGLQMSTDPFEKFESSRSGLIIPLAVFVLGGCLTYVAIGSLRGVFLRQVEAAKRLQPGDPDLQGDPVPSGPVGIAPAENAAGENAAGENAAN